MLAEKTFSTPTTPRSSIYNRHRMSLPSSRAYIHPYFASRKDTGVMLAKQIKYYAHNPDTVVLSIKPTATELAYEIAKELELPLDLFLISSFQYDGMTVGAITDRSDQPLLKEQIIRGCNTPKEVIDDLIAKERIELETLKTECCPLNLPLPCSENATLILCTDGIQSGQNARNTIAILKKILGYRGKIVLVAGIMGSDAQKMFMKETEDAIAILCPQVVGTVASWYENTQVPTNEEVKQILLQAKDLSKII